MAALDKADTWQAGSNTPLRKPFELPSAFADRLSPPPVATETQVDWDTLEPVKEVPVWNLLPWIWIAGVSESEYQSEPNGVTLKNLVYGTYAIGHTRESALRNLAELQSIRT